MFTRFLPIRFIVIYCLFFLVQTQHAVCGAPNSNYVSAQENLVAKNRLIEKPYTFEVIGKSFVGFPKVFSPKECGEDGFFVQRIPIQSGEDVLEIGSGAGFFPVFAVSKGAAKVVATDINQDAIANTLENAKLHGMESKIEAIQSDIFNSIPGNQKYDMIYWNIPFTPTKKTDLTILDLAVFDPGSDLLERYLAEASQFLKKNGRLYLGYSATHGDVPKMKAIAAKHHWTVQLLAHAGNKDTIVVELYEFSQLSLAKFRPATKPSSPDDAYEALKGLYNVDRSDLVRNGELDTGAGCWDAIIEHEGVETRVSRCGPGEFVPPHTHGENELFHVTSGATDIWLSTDGLTWQYRRYRAGDTIDIPAGTIHRLVVDDQEGLTMHISRNDLTRGVFWRRDLNRDYENTAEEDL